MTSRDDEEVVTMATVRSLLAVQESMLKTLFESVVNGINNRMDDLEKFVSDITASLEFSQTETGEARREGASLLFSSIRSRSTHHYQCDVT